MTARSNNDPENTPSAEVTGYRLSIAVEENFPPFVYVNEGQVAGLAIDNLDAAARLSGLELEYIPVQASNIQAIMAEGKADAAFPLAINPDRLALFNFSEPVLTTGGGLFVAASSTSPAGLEELDGKAIATPATGPLAAFIRANAPNTKLLLTSDYVEPLRMVVSGEADAAALNLEAGRILAEQLFPGRITSPATYFLELPLALGVPKSNPEKLSILRLLNNAIKTR